MRLGLTNISICSCRAYEKYKKAVEAGDDGKENFHARKACEYLKMAVEVRKGDGDGGVGSDGDGVNGGGNGGSNGKGKRYASGISQVL